MQGYRVQGVGLIRAIVNCLAVVHKNVKHCRKILIEMFQTINLIAIQMFKKISNSFSVSQNSIGGINFI
jgi:hypothetical protein